MNLNKIKKSSYLILVIFLVIFETFHITKGHWQGDFFEHSAVVNELSKNLLHPNNPIIKSNTSHAFFSPYSILVASFSKVTDLNSINSLAYFAYFNLIFFLYSLYFFSKSIFKKNYGLIASLILLFTMFLWGESPFVWSGFYHIFVLHKVLAYPSTFAISITLLTLGLVSKNHKKYFFTIIFCSTVVIISHPTTAIILFISIFTLVFSHSNYSIKRAVFQSIKLIFPSILLSLAWPYFNIVELFIGNKSAADFHDHSFLMYTDILKKNWPILLTIPCFIYSKKNAKVVFITLTIIFLTLVYITGYLFNFYGVSRVISGVMFFSHVLIAYTVTSFLAKSNLFKKRYLLFVLSVFLLSISLNFMELGKVFMGIFKKKDIEYYNKFSFLKSEVTPNDIILSDSKSNWIIPSYNGKVIASRHPLYWIDDYKERRTDVTSFFSKESSDSLRLITIQNYRPDYILINFSNIQISCSTHRWLKSLGETVYEENNLELLKLHQK